MSAVKSEVETFFGRCSCCLAYGYLKNMWKEHQFDGETEVYGEMLVQCFALTWDRMEDSMEQDQICAQCILRLRDARDFKKVVLNSQDDLQLHEPDNEIIIDIKEEEDILEEDKPESEADIDDDPEFIIDTVDSVKDETDYEEIEFLDDEDMPAALDTDSSKQTDQSKQVRIRRKPRRLVPDDDDGPKGKWPKKLPKSERRKTYRQYSEEDLRKCLEEVRKNVLTPAEASAKYNVPQKTICAKIRAKPDDVLIDNVMSSNNGKNLSKRPRASETKTKVTETKEDYNSRDTKTNDTKQAANPDDHRFMYKHKANIKTILQNTNATLIKAYARDGFSCNFCQLQGKDPFELKQHNLKNHTNDKDTDEAIKVTYVTDLILKLDTTCFKCNICKQPLNTVEDCMAHLSEVHSKDIYTDVKNYIIPFKFEYNDFRCFMCDKSFKYFKLLSEHMPEHYRNFECSVCERGFINKQSMQLHMYRHNKGVFKCSHCDKEFDSKPKKTNHERIVHLVTGQYRKCAHCKLRFSSWDAVRDHEFNAHGVEKPTHACEDCGKTFNTQGGLIMHNNRFHLCKKPHKCSSCDMTFCTKAELRYHTVTHTKTRDLKCKVCAKGFGTPISLANHMKIHVREKKIRCDHCERKFLQRRSYERHIKSQHGDEVDPNREKMIQLIKEIKIILTFTNATPFKSKIIRYYCAYCSTDGPHFEDPDDLRTHTRTEHVGHRTEKIEYAMRPYWMNEVIKLDIDNLLCTVCCVVINNWNDMFKHLKEKHNIVLDQAYTRVIPYVLRSNLQCALCKESFSNYLHLDGHMNAHYNNYICNDCGETFLNHARLKQHALKHNTGKFSCSFCDKVFTLQKYRRKHEETIHEQRTKFKCQYCPERFAGEYLRHLHCLEAHPDTVKTITCEFCGDVFTWKQYYTSHIRKKHQKRKPYECAKCNKKFFGNHELKEHMLRHAGAKNFECPVCHKRYVSMNSLKQHAKQHKKKNEA